MTTERIIAHLAPPLAEYVRKMADKRQISRSSFIGRLVEDYKDKHAVPDNDNFTPVFTKNDILSALKEADDPNCRTTFYSKEDFLRNLNDRAKEVLAN